MTFSKTIVTGNLQEALLDPSTLNNKPKDFYCQYICS